MRGAILVSLIWLAALAAGVALAPRLASVAVSDPLEFFPRESRTRIADAALAERFPSARAPSQIVVVLETDAPPMLPGARARIASLAARLRAELPGDVLSAVLAPTDDPVLAQRLVAADGRAALVVARLSLGFASERGYARLAVVSGVGTREYYRARGFADGELYQQAALGRAQRGEAERSSEQ